MKLLTKGIAASATLLILNYVFHYSFREAAEHSQSKALATRTGHEGPEGE
jgi:hypothetical protein